MTTWGAFWIGLGIMLGLNTLGTEIRKGIEAWAAEQRRERLQRLTGIEMNEQDTALAAEVETIAAWFNMAPREREILYKAAERLRGLTAPTDNELKFMGCAIRLDASLSPHVVELRDRSGALLYSIDLDTLAARESNNE